MRKFLFNIFLVVIGILSVTSFAEAATRVSGYMRSNGTYVQSYYRSSPNSTRYDNYSYRSNVNPYTGKSGSKW